MVRVFLFLFLAGIFLLTAGCAAFLEDYSYQPIQEMSSSSY